MSKINLEVPTRITGQVCLGCAQRESETNKRIMTEESEQFHRLASSIHNFKSDKRNQRSWSCDMQGHAQKCVARFCELAMKTTDKLHTISTPRLDDKKFKNDELETVGDLCDVRARIV